MDLVLLLVEERNDERWLLQRALARAGILPHSIIVPAAEQALNYIAAKEPFADRTRFPLPRTLVLPATLESMTPTTLIRKLAALSFVWNGRIVLLSASEQHPEAVETVRLGGLVFLRPFAIRELADALREIYEMATWRKKAA